MTRLFLAAGVAAIAIAAPAAARPGGHGGGDQLQQRGGEVRAQAFERRGGGGGAAMAAPRGERQQRFAAFDRPQRAERMQMRAERPQLAERMQMRAERPQHAERMQMRAERLQSHDVRPQRVATRAIERQQARAARIDQVRNRTARTDMPAQRQQLRADRQARGQDLMAQRQQLRADRQARSQDLMAQRQQLRFDRQAQTQALQADRQNLRAMRVADAQAFRNSRLATWAAASPTTRIIAPADASRVIGMPLATATSIVPMMAVPQSVSYLYPDTPDYYYRYGDGYMYQVDRSSNLISALLPLLAGGFMPGQMLPSSYMNSPMPDYYGLNSFYPASYGSDYGYGYQNLCNRYANGVVYQVDCMTGMVQDVVPLYAGGYGVGQMLPSAYYNLPNQYRGLYSDTSDYGYYYAPGAIYQYDQSNSLITSVAALLSPGFSVGQQLPAGYDTYNVPYAYRDTYYDSPNAWYRYNNGNIYQVDPTTQLITAIVASILT